MVAIFKPLLDAGDCFNSETTAVSDVKRPLCVRFRSEAVTNKFVTAMRTATAIL
jgi:hypothetical protein